MCAAIDARRGRGRPAGGRPPPRARSEPRGGASDGARPPRRCPNCGDTRAALKCPKPAVEFGQRPCWNCKKVGHSSRDCPKAKTVAAVGSGEPLIIASVERNAFAAVKRGARPRPAPKLVTFGDFVQGNAFAHLVGETCAGRPRDEPEPRRPRRATPARSCGPASSNHLERPRPSTAPTTSAIPTTTSDPVSPRIPLRSMRAKSKTLRFSEESIGAPKNEAEQRPGERRAADNRPTTTTTTTQSATTTAVPESAHNSQTTTAAATTPTIVENFKNYCG